MQMAVIVAVVLAGEVFFTWFFRVLRRDRRPHPAMLYQVGIHGAEPMDLRARLRARIRAHRAEQRDARSTGSNVLRMQGARYK